MRLITSLAVAAPLLATGVASAAQFTRHLVRLTGVAPPYLTAIGASGEVAGVYYDSATQACHGFLLNGTRRTTLPNKSINGQVYWLEPTSIASNGDVAGLAMKSGTCVGHDWQISSGVNAAFTGRAGFLYRAKTGETLISSSLVADFAACPGLPIIVEGLLLNASDHYVLSLQYINGTAEAGGSLFMGSLNPGAAAGQVVSPCAVSVFPQALGMNDANQVAGSVVESTGNPDLPNSLYGVFSFPISAPPTATQLVQGVGTDVLQGGLINNAGQVLVFGGDCGPQGTKMNYANLTNAHFTTSTMLPATGNMPCAGDNGVRGTSGAGELGLGETGYAAWIEVFAQSVNHQQVGATNRIFVYHHGITHSFPAYAATAFPMQNYLPGGALTIVGVDAAGDIAFNLSGTRADGSVMNASYVETCSFTGC